MITEVLSHNLLLFVIAVITSMEVFFYAKQMVLGSEEFTGAKRIFCGVLNGVALLYILSLDGFLKTVLMLGGCPILLCLELMLFTKDKILSYIYVYIKLVMNFMSVFWIVVAIAGTGANIMGNERMIMSFTLVIVGCMSLFFGSHKKYPMNELRILIHDLKRGKLFFIYLILGDLFLVASSLLLTPLLQSVEMEGPVKTIISLELFLKTFAILGFSYLLLYGITKEIKSFEEFEHIKETLATEKRFRSTIQRKGMLNVLVDLATGELKDGRTYFRDEPWVRERNFDEVIRQIAEKVIHPEDRQEFIKNNNKTVILKLMETTPYFSQQIRISPRKVVQHFCLAGEYQKLYENSEKPWMWIKIDYIYTQDMNTGDVSLFLVAFDVDEQVSLKEKLHLSATTDALTGLLNRTIMQYEIENKLQEAGRAGVMILMDIDNFKGINDKLGHPVGDEVLVRFSGVLRDLFRRSDVIGRLGGDEFSVFMPGTPPISCLEEKAKDLNEKGMFVYNTEDGEEISTSVSIGIAIADPNDTYDTLYKKADEALYRSKEKGKKTHSYYSSVE